MSANNFTKILENAIHNIRDQLKKNYDLKYKEFDNLFQDSDAQKKLEIQIDLKQKQINILEEEIKRLGAEVEELNPKLKYFEIQELRNKYPDINFSGYITRSGAEAQIKLENDIVNTNRLEFEKIVNRFINMMNLAVGSKEQRNILINFYTLDWKSLGIDIPTDLSLRNILIEDGKIIADKTLMLSNGK